MCSSIPGLDTIDASSTSPPPAGVARHYQMFRGGRNYPKLRPLPGKHNLSHGPCIQFFFTDQLSPRPLVSPVPALYPLLHPAGGTIPPPLSDRLQDEMLSTLLLSPIICSKFNAHCSCHEIFALYLPNICSLRKSLPNVLLQQEKTHFHSVFPFGFVYVCFF